MSGLLSSGVGAGAGERPGWGLRAEQALGQTVGEPVRQTVRQCVEVERRRHRVEVERRRELVEVERSAEVLHVDMLRYGFDAEQVGDFGGNAFALPDGRNVSLSRETQPQAAEVDGGKGADNCRRYLGGHSGRSCGYQ